MDGMDKLIIVGIIFALIGVIECIVSKKGYFSQIQKMPFGR